MGKDTSPIPKASFELFCSSFYSSITFAISDPRRKVNQSISQYKIK